jgi:hypothetical protein
MTTDHVTQSAQSARYSGTFTLDSWEQDDEQPADGLTRSRARLTKTFSGDLTGTSRTEILIAALDSGTRSYCGYEQFTGTVAGREGSLVLRHAAEGDADGAWMTWQVVPGSGRGDLTGASGEGQIDRREDGSHTYWLELSLG